MGHRVPICPLALADAQEEVQKFCEKFATWLSRRRMVCWHRLEKGDGTRAEFVIQRLFKVYPNISSYIDEFLSGFLI